MSYRWNNIRKLIEGNTKSERGKPMPATDTKNTLERNDFNSRVVETNQLLVNESDDMIKRRKWNWMGHTIGQDAGSIARTALDSRPQGARKKGK